MTQDERDRVFMSRALELAKMAAQQGEVPIGCILVSDDGQIVGEGMNQPIALNDPTAHAEILAIRQACQKAENYRLDKSVTAYVTLEPCMMCAGALLHSRIGRVVIAATDSRPHSLHNCINVYSGEFGNHTITRDVGVCADLAQEILTQFFKERR